MANVDTDFRFDVLWGVSSSAALIQTVSLIRELTRDHTLKIATVMSPGAKQMISPQLISALSGQPVFSDWSTAQAGLGPMPHIELARSAPLMVLAPVTARVLSDLATGRAADLLTTTVIAFPGKVIVAPAMNPTMWAHPAVRANWRTIKKNPSIIALDPENGPVACGDEGPGRMASPARLFRALESARRPALLKGKSVVVYAGPTREPIDAVRYISNASSGKMGVSLAAVADWYGADVTLIHGPLQTEIPPGIQSIPVQTALEMKREVELFRGKVDFVIACAAVSDFRPDNVAAGKIDRRNNPQGVTVALQPNPDILKGISRWRPRPITLGFSLEVEKGKEKAVAKLEEKGCDFMFSNPVDVTSRSGSKGFLLSASSETPVFVVADIAKEALAEKLLLVLAATRGRGHSKRKNKK